jgi:hypothetical protein
LTTYRFGDRAVISFLPLRELPILRDATRSVAIAIAAHSPTVRPRRIMRWLHHWRNEHGGGISLSLARLERGYLLRFPKLYDFLLDLERRTITVVPFEGIEENTLEHLLLDQVLPRFLAHEGELLIHASAVTVDDRTVLFLGRSGWGKSTLAGLLQLEGHTVLSDDCVVVRTRAGTVMALPTYPSLRLHSDTLEHVFPDATGLMSVAGQSGKRRLLVRMAEDVDSGRRVDAIYVLSEPSDAIRDHAIVAQRPAATCLQLIRHAFQLDFTDRERASALLANASEAARSVPAFGLSHPRDFRQAGVLTAMITRHVESLLAESQDPPMHGSRPQTSRA